MSSKQSSPLSDFQHRAQQSLRASQSQFIDVLNEWERSEYSVRGDELAIEILRDAPYRMAQYYDGKTDELFVRLIEAGWEPTSSRTVDQIYEHLTTGPCGDCDRERVTRALVRHRITPSESKLTTIRDRYDDDPDEGGDKGQGQSPPGPDLFEVITNEMSARQKRAYDLLRATTETE